MIVNISHELLIMGLEVPESCWPYKKYNNVISGIYLGFYSSVITMMHGSLQPGHYSSLTAPNLQPTANQELNDQYGNQHHSCELLMMGIVVPETCWAYKKYNKIISGF